MHSRKNVAAVIPCLNEAASISRVLQSVRPFISTIIVVDDGSSDDTARIARSAGAIVLRNAVPRGKGAALMIGWNEARRLGFAWALCLDGDGQHAAADIPNFLAAMECAPLVIGNRMANPVGMPWLRKNVNRWMSRRISKIAGRELPDTQCGFRLMNLDCWEELPTLATHFEIESDLLLAFLAAGFPVEFVPVQVIYKTERSKIRPFRDTIRWFRWLRAARRNFSQKSKIKMETVRATN
jgi:glycosyltransferase involved in cell wall biosynthesis